MPTYLRQAYQAMLPRLQAEDSLRLVAAVAAGSGGMKPHVFSAYMASLRRQSEPAQAPVRSTAGLGAMGIRVSRKG